ncbi:MAG: hypothetical protein ACOXZ4_03015 [Sphaerochaetaceae bacterium]
MEPTKQKQKPRRKRNASPRKARRAGAAENRGKTPSAEIPKIPMVQEPLVSCSLCGKPIEAISEAISGQEEHTYSHFDCVLQKIAQDEQIQPPQKVSYIGRGVFAIVSKDETGHYTFEKEIPYESAERFAAMKKFVEESKQ